MKDSNCINYKIYIHILFFTCYIYDKRYNEDEEYWIFWVDYLKVKQWVGLLKFPCIAKPNLEGVTHFKKW